MAVNLVEFGGKASPSATTGRWLAHASLSILQRAFIAAELHDGKCVLVNPTVVQAAALARVNKTYVHHALKHFDDRVAVLAGIKPLVLPRQKALSGLNPAGEIWLGDIKDFIDRAGVSRVRLMLDHIEHGTPAAPAITAAE